MNRIPLPEHITAKVRRAEHHLLTLRAVLDEYAATQPLVIEPFFASRPGGGGWGVRLQAVSSTPINVPLLVGDFLHNLRSSLDYLARALVSTSGNDPKDGIGGTTFPIATKSRPEGTLGVKGGVDSEIGLVLESHQPYMAYGEVERHPLQLLHKFCNIDKHRALHLPLMAAVEPVSMIVGNVDPLPIGIIQPTLRPFAVGEELVPPIAPFSASTEVDVVVALHPIVALEGAYHYEGVGTVSLEDQLDYMLKTVRDSVIPSFRQFFSDPWPDEYFISSPVLGPLGISSTPEEMITATSGMVEFLATKYKSDHYIVLGLMEGISA